MAVGTAVFVVGLIVIAIVAGVAGYFAGMAAVPPPPPGVPVEEHEALKSELESAKSELESARKEIEELKRAALPKEIKIGVLLAFSGPLGPMGAEIKKGAELAAKEINEKGGIAGSKVVLIFEDTGTDAKKALEAAKKLIEVDGVEVIIGAMASGCTIPSGRYSIERHVVQISPCSTSPKITTDFEPHDYLFRTVGSDVLQGRALAEIIVDKGYGKVVTLVLDNPYGIGIEEVAMDVFEEEGVDVVASIRYDPAKMDFRAELEQIKAAGPEAVLYVGYYEDGVVMFRQAMEIGVDGIPWVCAEGVFDYEEVAKLGSEMTVRLIGTVPAPPEGTLSYEIFRGKFKREYGTEPPIYTDTTYDAVMLAALAIEHAGVYDGAKIRDALEYVSQFYVGASGWKMFDENGDQIAQSYKIWETEGNAFKKIGYWLGPGAIKWYE